MYLQKFLSADLDFRLLFKLEQDLPNYWVYLYMNTSKIVSFLLLDFVNYGYILV